jgi:hypothetical protein
MFGGPKGENAMRTCKRILAAIVLPLSMAGLLLSVAVGVAVWIVKEPVRARATQVFERIEGALDVADGGLTQVKASLRRAAERLDTVRAEQRKLAQQPRRSDALRRMLARTVQQRVAPELGNAQEQLHTMAEAAVAVNSVLEDLGNLPFLSAAGLDSDQLTEMNGRLSRVAPAAWELSRLLGEQGPGGEAGSAETELSRIDRALKALQGLLADYDAQLKQVRQRTEALKSRTLSWITPAAIIISVVCFWIGLSQISLICHALSWWKQAGAGNL